MRGLIITKQAHLSLSADDWQLYTTMPGVNDAAIEMNLGIANLLNSSTTALEFWRRNASESVLKKYDDFGARDSEPMYVLERIVETFYGKPRPLLG